MAKSSLSGQSTVMAALASREAAVRNATRYEILKQEIELELMQRKLNLKLRRQLCDRVVAMHRETFGKDDDRG